MSDSLNPRTQAFLRSVQDGDDPTRDDYDRVRSGVKTRLAASVAAGVAALVTAKTAAASEAAAVTVTAATTTAAAASAATAVTTAAVGTGAVVPASGLGAAFLTKLAAVVLVVGAAAGGTTAIVRHQQATRSTATEATVHVASAPAPTPVSLNAAPAPMPELAPEVAPTLTPAPAPAPTPTPAPAPTTAIPNSTAAPPPPTLSPLDAEIALVRDARTALRGGDASRALSLLDEHARRFPRGALAEDCDAERVYALCALGRNGEARSVAARFTASHPASPYGPSVRASCGGEMN